MATYRRPLVTTPSMYIVRRAMTDGLRGGSRLWRVILIAVVARRAFRKIMNSDVRTVAFERIKPGDTVIMRGVTSRDLPSS